MYEMYHSLLQLRVFFCKEMYIIISNTKKSFGMKFHMGASSKKVKSVLLARRTVRGGGTIPRPGCCLHPPEDLKKHEEIMLTSLNDFYISPIIAIVVFYQPGVTSHNLPWIHSRYVSLYPFSA